MALIKKLNDLTPKFGKHCYFSEGAAIIGDVTMGDDCTVWFNAVLRGDVHFIKIGNRVNIQDGSCLHTLYGKAPIVIGDDVTVGHNVTLHGCEVKSGALIGMGSTILDHAVVGHGAIVAAGALVLKNTVIGDGELDIMNDAEIPAIIYDVFSAMGLKRFQIRINNRRVLNGFYSMLGLTEQSGEIMRTVDKIEKIGPDMVRAILVDDVKLTDEQADEILKFIAITGTNDEVLAALKGYCGRDELFDRGYEELSTVIKYLGGFGVAQENFKVDLTIARGLDYYTGTVYETALLDYPQIGSVCSGGRYDNLAEYYTDRKLPGVGISIGVTRLFYVLGEQGLLNDALNTAPADVLLLPMTEDLSFAVSLATRLRERGLRAQLYTENKKFKAKMNYADKTKIPYVLFLGEDEVSSGVVTCKDMVTGEQTKGAPDEIIARIYAAIREKNAQKVIVEK